MSKPVQVSSTYEGCTNFFYILYKNGIQIFFSKLKQAQFFAANTFKNFDIFDWEWTEKLQFGSLK